METFDSMVYKIGTQKVTSKYWGNPHLTISDLMFHIQQEGRTSNPKERMLGPHEFWEGEVSVIKNIKTLLDTHQAVFEDVDEIYGSDHDLTVMAKKIVDDGKKMMEGAEIDLNKAKRLVLITYINSHYQQAGP